MTSRPARLALALLAAAAGCGPRHATVSGTVALDGRPVGGGLVILAATGGRSAAGVIGPDGRYRADGVPVGPLTVVVMPPPPAEPAGPAAPVATAAPVRVPVPAKYANAATSGLSFTAAAGANVYDIDLASR